MRREVKPCSPPPQRAESSKASVLPELHGWVILVQIWTKGVPWWPYVVPACIRCDGRQPPSLNRRAKRTGPGSTQSPEIKSQDLEARTQRQNSEPGIQILESRIRI